MDEWEEYREKINRENSGYMRLNGIHVTALAKGYCECQAALGPDVNNPHGIAHGGFLFTVCDNATGIAGSTLGRKVVSRSADIHFLHPGRGAYVTAKARMTEAGHTTGLCQVEMFDEHGTLIVTGSFELYFIG